MLTISPCLDRQIITSYSRKCKLPYSDSLYLYLAENNGETLAAALFEVGGNEVHVLLYEGDPGDSFILDGVLRAGLNYAAGHGIENGVIPEELRQRHSALFAALNYPIQPVFNITNFFAKYKNCAEL